MLTMLRDDALISTSSGCAVRIALPWIRALPLSSLGDLAIEIDGRAVTGWTGSLAGRSVAVRGSASDDALPDENAWWFVQDRLSVESAQALAPGIHEVSISFRLTVPYLPGGDGGPLTLPFGARRRLELDADVADPAAPPAFADGRTSAAAAPAMPSGWRLAASAFNWTAEIVRAERPAVDIVTGIVADGIAATIELEPGQLWRSFPQVASHEADALRARLAADGGAVSIVGMSLDDWLPSGERRDDEARLAFLAPQLTAAQAVGAEGVRLPIGQAGTPLLRRLLPLLADHDLTLFEEMQGPQHPDAVGAAIDAIADLDDPRVRLLVDASMLMPALPVTYLERIAAAGVPPQLVTLLSEHWLDPATNDAVVALLRAGGVPPAAHALFMNLLVRFGRTPAAALRPVLPLVGAFHLKFWDLDDSDGRVSQPIRDLAAELALTDFSGTLCSEWGGHEWLDDDPADVTRRHLELAHAALSAR